RRLRRDDEARGEGLARLVVARDAVAARGGLAHLVAAARDRRVLIGRGRAALRGGGRVRRVAGLTGLVDARAGVVGELAPGDVVDVLDRIGGVPAPAEEDDHLAAVGQVPD